jgi:hypothetical protein
MPPATVLGDCRATATGPGEITVHAPDIEARCDIATWCLNNGYVITKPFAHADDAELVAQHLMRRKRRFPRRSLTRSVWKRLVASTGRSR